MGSRRQYDENGRPSSSKMLRRHTPRRGNDAMARRGTNRMMDLFEQFDRDMAAFHDSFFPVMEDIMQEFPSGGYMYESRTTRVDQDGHRTMEKITSRPGRDGNPETKRYFRDADGRETVETTREPPPNPFEDFDWPFRNFGMGGFGTPRLPPRRAQVYEVTEEEEARRNRRSRRSRRPRVIVEEPDDEEPEPPRRNRGRKGRLNH